MNIEEQFKLPRLKHSETVKQISNTSIKNEKYYMRPQMKRILYAPFVDPKQKQFNKYMIESCVTNRRYEDIHDEENQKKIQSNLGQSKGFQLLRRISLGYSKSLVGKDATLKYYENYKKLDKLLDQSILNKQNVIGTSQYPSSYLPILSKSKNLEVLPLCLGLIKEKGQSSLLDIKGYHLGDKYITALGAGLKQANLIQKCVFSNNRITDKGAKQILSSVNRGINLLDLSFNKLTKIDKKLLQLIIEPDCHLQKLNLESNQIKSLNIIQTLLRNVMYSKHLKVLNIRSNQIRTQASDIIQELLLKQTCLEEIYLGTNFLMAKGAEKIFNALQKNKNLRILDLSLNQLGEDQKNLCAIAIGNCLTKNKTLHHLDLSSNNFDEIGSKIIAEGLQPNKKLYGIHFKGNYGYIDSRGFLILQQKQLTSLHSFVENKINSYQITFRREHVYSQPKVYKNVCWICEGWYEQQFRFTIPQQFNQQKKLVYIHFDFEMFTPRLINLTEKNVKYTAMVPPKKYRYFFTFNKKQYFDKNAIDSYLQFPEEFTYQMNHQIVKFNVDKLSERTGKPKKITNNWNQIIIHCLPRNTGLMTKKEKQPWTYEKSAWAKQWKLQDEDSIKKCFQRDWKHSKISNLVKNQTDQDKVKDKLYNAYRSIKQIYRYFSSWSPFGDVWAVSNNAWTQFCQQAKIINKDLPLKISDLTFITTNSMSSADWKSNQLVPERGLVRFQFMEALVRLSQQKYKKNGVTENFQDSIGMLLKDHILPLACSLPFERWRRQKFFVEENDIIIKGLRPIFSNIYKKNSKAKVKPGQKPFMCLNQFKSIFQRSGIAGTQVIQRDMFVSFNCSMMTQVDQVQNQRFLKMSQIQFIQGIARIAEALPKDCIICSKQKSITPLHYKFQWLTHEIKNNLCSQDIKSQFSQTKSLFDEDSQQNQ